MLGRLKRTFASLAEPNFRRYFVGHGLSTTGEWMHRLAQAWLILELTGSGTLLGATAALQQLPLLLVGPWGGVLADRVDTRKLLLVSQGASACLATLLGWLTASGHVQPWMVMGLACALGTTKALDRPAKQAFVFEMVGRERLVNAVALNSIVFNAAKAVGPAIAGVSIAALGLATTFYLNAISYLAVIVALLLIRPEGLIGSPRVGRSRGQILEAIRHVRDTPELFAPLLMTTVSGVFVYEWAVTLPLFASNVFEGEADVLGAMYSAMGMGAVVGGLVLAGTLRATSRALVQTGCAFGLVVVLAALVPTLPLVLLALFMVGASSIAFRSTATAIVQLESAPQMRGRVLALLTMALSGTSAVGAPLVGWLAELVGVRFTLLLGGLLTLGTSILVGARSSVRRRHTATAPPHVGPEGGES